MPHFTIIPFNDESAWRWCFCDRFCDRKMMFQWAKITLRRSVPCFRNWFFALQRWIQLIVGFSKWLLAGQNGSPLCSGRIFRCTVIGKWPPYGGSLLDAEVFHPLERIEPVFNAFQWAFLFHLTRISLYSYPHQARHRCNLFFKTMQICPNICGW